VKLKKGCCDILKLGKVIGNVVASVKDPGLEGLRLLIVQGLDDNFKSIGDPYVAADGIQTAGPGDIVYVVSKKEAAIAISRDLVPIDECIVGFVEEYTVIKEAKKKSVEAKRKAKVQPPPKKVSRSRPPSKKSSLIREKSVPPPESPPPESPPPESPPPESPPPESPPPESPPPESPLPKKSTKLKD
jgi:microcompartment protein CcmK/EutM